MIITSSQIDLTGKSYRLEKHTKSERLITWINGQEQHEKAVEGQDTSLAREAKAFAEQAQALKVSLSSEAVALQRAAPVEEPGGEVDQEQMLELKFSILKKLVEQLTGRKIKPLIFNGKEFMEELAAQKENPLPQQAAEPNQLEGWGVAYDYHEEHYEMENTSFSAAGTIETADGQSIAFDVSLQMEREFASTTDLSIRAGDALKDPLVINFNGTAAELTQRSFQFDLDVDGQMDDIAFVRPGSGFLALDRNQNGKIDDGSELFGPQTGNGFEELARFDLDGNNWIDENDAVFNQLMIWEKGGEGGDNFFALMEKEVGAIYLGRVATPFELKDSENQLLGKVQSTGIHIQEDGTVGTVQQIDLAV